MLKKNKSIRKKLLIAMSSFCLIIMAQLVVSYIVIDRISEVNTLKSRINEINSMWYEIRNNSLTYFNQETRNVDYFETGRSEYLWKVKRLDQKVKNELAFLMNDDNIRSMDIRKYAESARMTFYKYQTYFHDIEVRQLAIGYMDYGLEGEMRSSIIELEKSKIISLEKLLTIKRNEKNFILRGEKEYADAAVSLANELLVGVKKNTRIRKTNEEQLIRQYINAFNNYVEHTLAIGSNKIGLRSALNREAILLDRDLLKLSVKFNKQYQQQMKILVGIIILTAIIIVLLTLLLSYVVSNSLSKPIVRLAEKLKTSFTKDSENTQDYKLPKNAPLEAVQLDSAFTSMLLQIKNQVTEINGINGELKVQNEELTQLNQELDRFIYHTSHDLRSPLTSVSGLIEILETSKDEEDTQEYLNHMKFCIEQMDQTIAEIIHFYKNRSIVVKNEPLFLYETVDVIYNQNKYHPLANDITFKIETDPAFRIYSDSYRLNIILSNLISNSLKYKDTKKSKPWISVRGYEQNSQWVIEVEDNGIGIPEKHINRIFHMFYRTSDKSTGSGLGLYIATESIKRIGGELKVKSIEGSGSVFSIILPMTGETEEVFLESKLV